MTDTPQPSSSQLIFWYKNHRGEEGYRRVFPIRVYYGRTDYYPEVQWLLAADDLEKGEYRVFAMSQIRGFVGPRCMEIAAVSSGERPE